MVEIPPELVWDYPSAPPDELWRLQRIAEFFPRFGRDRATVVALFGELDSLRIPAEVRQLIILYARHYGIA